MKFNEFSDKAKSLYSQVAQEVAKEVMKESKNINDKVKQKSNSDSSSQNTLVKYGEDYVSNPTISKAAQLIYEKSIEKAEQFIDKYIRPYNVFEIIEPEFAKEIVNDLELKIEKGKKTDQNYFELTVLYINLNDLYLALEASKNIKDPNIKDRLKLALQISQLGNNDFIEFYDKNIISISDSNIYNIFKRRAKLALEVNDYTSARSAMELCCVLNPISQTDQSDLLLCYEKLGESNLVQIQKDILDNIGVTI